MEIIISHAFLLTSGIGATVLGFSFFYLLGLSVTPGRFLGAAKGSDYPFFLGAALFVVWSWYGIKMGVPHPRLVQMLMFLTGAAALIRYRQLDFKDLGSRIFSREALVLLGQFSLLYMIAYFFLMPRISGYLPLVSWSNNDIFNYINASQHIQRLGASNIVGMDQMSAYFPTPAIFHFLSFWAVFFGSEVMDAAMPVLYGATALIGLAAIRISKSVFQTPTWIAVVIGAVLISGPFFRYITMNFFISQLVGTVAFLYLLGRTMTLFSAKERAPFAGLLVNFVPYQLVLFFSYPTLFFTGVIVQLGLALLCVLESHRVARLRELRLRPLIGGSLPWLVSILGAAVVVALVDYTFLGNIVGWVLYLSTKNVAGWPIEMISPLSILGFPLHFILEKPIWKWSHTLLFLAILLPVAYQFLFRHRKRTDPAGRAFLIITIGAFLVYFVYYWHLGASYQQWKFASFYPMTLAFGIVAAAVQLIRLRPASEVRSPDRRIAIFLLILVLLGATYHQYGPSSLLTRISDKYEKLRAIDDIAGFDGLFMSMVGTAPTFMAPYYVRSKIIYLTTESYYPVQPLEFSELSTSRPWFQEGSKCADAREGDAILFKDLGCLYFEAPITAGADLFKGPFRPLETLSFLINGMSDPREPVRRTDKGRAEMTFLSATEQLTSRRSGYLNLLIDPLLNSGTRGKKVVLSWGPEKSKELVVTEKGWVSVPYAPGDWIGNKLKTFSLGIEVTQNLPHEGAAAQPGMERPTVGIPLIRFTQIPVAQLFGEELFRGVFKPFKSHSFTLKGMSDTESWGRWNNGKSAELNFVSTAEILRRNKRGFLHFQLKPMLHAGLNAQRIVFTWGKGKRKETRVAKKGWVSIPHSAEDWKGGDRKRLTVRMEFPDAVAPGAVFENSTDPRLLATAIFAMAFTDSEDTDFSGSELFLDTFGPGGSQSVQVDGMSAQEHWGRWTDGNRAKIDLFVSSENLRNRPEGYLNIHLTPFLHSKLGRQRVKLSWGAGRTWRNQVQQKEWISLPYKAEDWTGEKKKNLTIHLELPDATSPANVKKNSSDERKLALGVISMSLTKEPTGRLKP